MTPRDWDVHPMHLLPRALRSVLATLVMTSVLAAGVVLGGLGEARADGPLPSADPAVKAAIELSRTRTRLDEVARRVADARERLATAEAAFAESDQQFSAAKAQIAELRSGLMGRAAEVYKQRGANLDRMLSIDSAQHLSAAARYADAAAGDTGRRLDDLSAREAQLEQERARRDQARRNIAAETAVLLGLMTDLNAARARNESLLQQMGVVSIMGEARLTAAQMAEWFRSTGQSARLPDGMTIDQLAQIYLEEGAAENLRGDIAFAQSVIETGSFGVTRGNNYAGIGNCDSCGGNGMMFPTPRDGVRAQIQLLRSYADPDSRAANLANPPVPQLFGSNPASAAAAYDNFGLKGRVPVWTVMGNGNWATDPDYASKVLEVYARMLGYASRQP